MVVLMMAHFCAAHKRGNQLKTIAPGDTRSNEDAIPPPITVFSSAKIRSGSTHPAEKAFFFYTPCPVTFELTMPDALELDVFARSVVP
jgi:hypothetical protein